MVRKRSAEKKRVKKKASPPLPAEEEPLVIDDDDDDGDGGDEEEGEVEEYELDVADAADYVIDEAARRAKRKDAAKKAWATRKAAASKPEKLHAAEGKAVIYRRFFDGEELTNEEVAEMDPDEVPSISPRAFHEPPTMVEAWTSTTIHVSEAVRVQFGARIQAPCYWEERHDCFNVLKEHVTAWVESEIKDATDDEEGEGA